MVDFRIAFASRSRPARQQPHWVAFEYDEDRYRTAPEGQAPEAWLKQEVRRLEPDIVLVGSLVGEVYQVALLAAADPSIRVGFWLEPLDGRRRWPASTATRAAVAMHLTISDFVLAIGALAERTYRSLVLPETGVWLVPYGADLSPCLSIAYEDKSERFRFLFSGQLLPRHNIAWIMKASERLLQSQATPFELVIAGHGPEQATIDRAVSRVPRLGEVIRYDREYSTWLGRLRPFCTSHVLICCCTYTGWGLVIPEAMAAQNCVLSSSEAGATEFFVRHRVNGIVIKPTFDNLMREMQSCLEHPEMVQRIGRRARQDALDGHAPTVAERMTEALLVEAARPPRAKGVALRGVASASAALRP
ncbi:MAG: glycosyltransferase family 4 protein [Microcella sp.]|uniref:glycosyltransferase family 4 protein n=1 Tax=Microcella sp. TaxID=1913979 RepID=UPI00331626AF